MPVAEAESEVPIDIDTALEVDDESLPSAPSGPTKPTKPIVGIIYPPPEVRNIVDKTASFVARNGPEFESRIKHNEQNNPKFNFLNTGDPYHAYYQHKVKEIQEGKSSQQSSQSAAIPGDLIQIKPPQQLIDEAKKKKQSELLKQVELPFVPKDPPADFEFFADPPSISAHDLDVVKLTAQFVARNGRQFLSSLMTREQRNYQFDFLRPQHSLFQYFTKLLEQYTKVLIPPKDIAKKLSNEDKKKIIEDVKYRANWIKHQEAQRRKEEEEAERERMAYACIDWHDFVVVETVDYQPFESGHFPPPTTPQEVGARVLLQDRILQGQNEKQPPTEEPFSAQDDTEVQDMEEDSDSSDDEEVEQPKQVERLPMPGVPTSLEPPREDRVIIKKGYDPKQAKVPIKEILRPVGPEEYTISPITGERIPVSKLQEHVRIGLLDPRWRDQRDRQLMEKVNQESVYAPGFAIDESLKQLAERRSDIFGVGVEETPIGKKVGEEERLPGMPWDPTPGLTLATQAAANAAQAEEKAEEAKKDSIGPNIETVVITSGPQPPQPPPVTQQPPQPPPPASAPSASGILQPPPPTPSLPSMAGIVRPVQGLSMSMPPPPGAQPPPPPGVNVMLMQGMPGLGQMRPLLAMPQPGFSPFNPAPPGTLQSRPPLLAPAPPVVPPLPSIIPQQQPPPSSASAAQDADEPPSKKAKNLEDSLISEAQFFASNPSPVTFNILMPSVPEKPEMNLQGQMIKVNLNLMETISVLKAKICEAIGLAPGKQKLRLIEGLFFKDSNSLAFYNVGDGATVHLSLKERGGRKK